MVCRGSTRATLRRGKRSVECDLLNRFDEFVRSPFGYDLQLTTFGSGGVAIGGKRPGENKLAYILADVDEPPGAGKMRTEPADIDVAGAIDLSHAEAREVQATAIIEIDLLILMQQRLRINARTEIEASQ